MPLPFRITLRKESGEQEEKCSGEINDEDWDLIESFRREAAKLRTAEWVVAGLDDNYTVQGDSSGNMVVTMPNRPPDSAVRELLHLLRPFALNNEATFFPKVTGKLWRYFTHPYLQRLLAEHRDGFDHGYGRAYFQLSVSTTPPEGGVDEDQENDFVINDKRAFDMWVNAFEYHRDEKKRKRLIEKLGAEPNDLTLANFRSMIADKARAVLHVASFLDDLVAAPSAAGARRAARQRGVAEGDEPT